MDSNLIIPSALFLQGLILSNTPFVLFVPLSVTITESVHIMF